MQLDLKQLKLKGTLEVEGVVDCSGVSEGLAQVEHVADADVTATAQFHEPFIGLTGKVESAVTYICSRCLKAFQSSLSAQLEETFSETEVDDEEVYHATGRYLDLDPFVHQAIHLVLESRPICRSDCKGLCSNCGTDLNESACSCETKRVDPRFAALEDLILGDDSE